LKIRRIVDHLSIRSLQKAGILTTYDMELRVPKVTKSPSVIEEPKHKPVPVLGFRLTPDENDVHVDFGLDELVVEEEEETSDVTAIPSEGVAPSEGAPAAPVEIGPDGTPLRRSKRSKKVFQLMKEDIWAFATWQDAMEALHQSFVAYESLVVPQDESAPEDPIAAFSTSADPDTMYYHEAMKEPDKAQFLEAMVKEVRDHTEAKNWEVIPKSRVPEGHRISPGVWAMKRKGKIKTGEVYKWKARLNFDGSKQEKGVNYWETYSPVATWPSIRMLLTMSLMFGWETRQVDYVLAYTQAAIETDLYMKLPRGFEVDGSPDDYVLLLKANLYGQKQAGRVWNIHLVERLLSIGFVQSTVDECVF
jgi:hypothetical protein